MIVTGIDPGLKGTAIVNLDGDEVKFATSFGKDTQELRDMAHVHPCKRYLQYNRFLKKNLNTFTVGTIILERPMGKLLGPASKLHELFGSYLMTLTDYVAPEKILLISATEIKKRFTGDGSAPKVMIIQKCKDLGYIAGNHHMADAYAMAYIGRVYKEPRF